MITASSAVRDGLGAEFVLEVDDRAPGQLHLEAAKAGV
jgi:hypothetical protein